MKVFILHHHLNTGGVTKVIDVQIDALKEAGSDVELIVGSDEDLKRTDIPVNIVEELNYLSPGVPKSQLDQNLESLTQKLKAFFQAHPDCIFHIHNLCLGKNPLVNLALEQLMQEGLSILNHCHDFAEDDRPHLMALFEEVFLQYGKEREPMLYPNQPASMRYAVINGMDKDRLMNKGIQEEHILDLPNAIAQAPQLDQKAAKQSIQSQLGLDDRTIILYPVRVIRRKNIGEVILLASLFAESAQFLVTQPPKNPEELTAYREWKAYCSSHSELPIHFEVGQKVDFMELMHGADVIISTSIQEGFGLGFLEPWLFDKPVMGRDLPEITKDFKNMGVSYSGLYNSLTIEGKDFSQYSVQEQQNIIDKCLQNSDFASQCRSKSGLCDLTSSIPLELVAKNKAIIEANYSPTAYGQKLSQFYAKSF